MRENQELDWKAFKCLNCDNFAAKQEEEVNMLFEDEELIESEKQMLSDILDVGYDEYGDYVYYFDDRSFNWQNDKNWKSTQNEGGVLTKCSLSIPGLV